MKNTKIEWADHTFNPWWGCTKISPACKHCYAESFAKRVGQDVWGNDTERRFLSDHHWSQPLQWNFEAAAEGKRRRVFCASMADVFEDRLDLYEPRERLWRLVEVTPHLDWLLLTKRPENIRAMAPWGKRWPGNVWIGTTAENQKFLDRRLHHLAEVPAAIRFISAEPLLGPLDLGPWVFDIDWVIAGGETGRKPRPTMVSWFRDLRDQCEEFGIPFHFKQWGDWAPLSSFPNARGEAKKFASEPAMIRVGKKYAGRELDGSVWDGLPKVPKMFEKALVRPRR